jgi:hypothetical protein
MARKRYKAAEATDGGDEQEDIDRIIEGYKEKVKSPLTGIRAHCVECFGGSIKGVSDCPSSNCALHPFRMGKNTMHALRGVAPKTGKEK